MGRGGYRRDDRDQHHLRGRWGLSEWREPGEPDPRHPADHRPDEYATEQRRLEARGWHHPADYESAARNRSYGRPELGADARGAKSPDRNRPYTREQGAQEGQARRSGAFSRGTSREVLSPQYRGRGPRNYRRSDERIRDDVCDALMLDPYVDASSMDVSVQGGEVTLAGTISSREQKRRAEDLAAWVVGVRDVSNRLQVSTSEQHPQTSADASRH